MTNTEVDFEREEKTLRLLIEQTTGAVLSFSLYSERAVRQQVTEWLQQHLSIPVQEVFLSPGNADPSVLLAAFPAQPRQCFVFHEVEAAFPKFLGYVNFHREELLDAGHALLFWIREEGLRRIAEEAPDFWAWRSRVFDFRSARGMGTPSSAPIDSTIARYSAADLEQQVSLLEMSAAADLVTQLALGRRLLALQRYEEADQALRLAGEIAENTNDRSGLAETLYLRGNIALQQNQLSEAEALYAKSVAAAAPSGDATLRLVATVRMGQIALQRGDQERAYNLAQEAVALAESLQNPVLLVEAYDQMANTLVALGNLRNAVQAYLKALSYGEKLGYTHAMGSTLVNLARVHNDMGDTALAQQRLEQAAKIFQESGFKESASEVQKLIAALTVS